MYLVKRFKISDEEQNSVKGILLGKKKGGLSEKTGFTSCPVLEVWL